MVPNSGMAELRFSVTPVSEDSITESPEAKDAQANTVNKSRAVFIFPPV